MRMLSEYDLRNNRSPDLLADVSQVCATDQAYLSGVPQDDYELYVSSVLAPEWEATDELTSPSLVGHQDSSLPFADIGSVELVLDDGDVFHEGLTSIDLAVRDDDCLSEAIQTNLQNNQFKIAIGASSACNLDDELFEKIGEGIADAGYILSSVGAGTSRGVTAEHLAKVWQIRPQDAERTLKQTTQLNNQSTNSSLSRQFGTNDRMLRYNRLHSVFFTDTMKVSERATSTRGYKYVQLFVSDTGFIYIFFMHEQKDYLDALKAFSKEVGAPDTLVCDPHPTQTKKEVRKHCSQIGTTLKILEARTQWADRAELYIGLVKEAVRKDLRRTDAPLVLWDYAMQRRVLIANATAKSNFKLQGETAHARTFGHLPDISNLCQWDFYDWCYYRDDDSFPYPKEVLGRVLGPAKHEGNEMAQYVLTIHGNVVPRPIHQILGTSYSLAPPVPDNKLLAKFEDVMSNEEFQEELPYVLGEEGTPDVPVADLTDATGKPITDRSIDRHSFTDTLIGAEVMLHNENGDKGICKVLREAVDEDGRTIGVASNNPDLSTLVYKVQCWDGAIREYSANVIAECILNEADENGHFSCELESIISHSRDGSAVKKEQLSTAQGSLHRKTTKGWKLKVKWRDGSSEWIALSDLKESYPVQVADYAKANDIAEEPAFTWWVPYVLRKREFICSSVKARMKHKNIKYGVRVPANLAEAYELDRQNGNNLWRCAYEKEMSNVGIAFRILGDGERAPGYTRASGHLIFDVKMDMTRKARWVMDGHRTPDPETSSYAGVVSKESIRVALTYAALHDVPVWAADIKNAYLSAPTSEKHYIVCGPEFGQDNVGRHAIITRALYGGKAAGRDYWLFLRKFMHEKLGFRSSRGDPDVWFRESKRKSDGSPYYEYVLLYTDDILVLSDNAESILRNEIGGEGGFELKPGSIGPPSQYLGGKMSKVTLQNGQKAWSFSSGQYVSEAVANVKKYLQTINRVLPRRAETPMAANYRPEVDISSRELSSSMAAYYHSLIGQLRWIVELGRADICLEVSMLSSHLALPREGHLDQVLHIFAYLGKHHNASLVFDPTEWTVPEDDFAKQDWNFSIYGCEGLKEVLPEDMPTPLGKNMRIRVFVDSDHAGDEVTRRSRTGFIVFLNNTPIYWHSKKQTSCETSTYGSEFIAMKSACEYVRGLRYKLRMMGLRVDEPAYIYGDNQSVLANSGNPGATLKKKTSAIAYHFVREGCVRDEWRTGYVNTHDNVADLFTKPLPNTDKRWKFVSMILAYLAPHQYYEDEGSS
ncbi:hypothetical protein THAOC_16700 [Thalassiosira oceanica]|uniref:Reverse transcriptase Ty1/copia-type domain-containing protein n=1 Tax=Thalassiosira oceanica TaxID=159749 RepID=K0S983_THAOC|nr:hypothetical protein THAOC_16700 [Thalassiosira oceanica]|eukprot:EJK62678.1 hypothetical protein THAOC_16700 [Thalassiosira oceanica]